MEKFAVDIDKVLDAFELDEDETEAVRGYDKLQLQFEAEGGGASGVAGEGGAAPRESGGGGGGGEHGVLGAYGGWSDSQVLQPSPCAPPPEAPHSAASSLLGLDLSSEVRGTPDGQNDDKTGACGRAPVAASLPPGHLAGQAAFAGSGAAGAGCQPLWPMAAQRERSPVAGEVPQAAPAVPQEEAGLAPEVAPEEEPPGWHHGVEDLDVVASRTIDVIPTSVPPDRGLATPLENTRPDLVHVWQSSSSPGEHPESGGIPAAVEEAQWGDRVGDGIDGRRAASVDAVDGDGNGVEVGRRLLPDLMSMKSSEEDSQSGTDFSEPAVVMENALAGPLPTCNPQEPAVVLENAVTSPPGPSSLSLADSQPVDLDVALAAECPGVSVHGGRDRGDSGENPMAGGGAVDAQEEDLSAHVCDNNPSSVTSRLYTGPPRQPSLPDVSAVCCPVSAPAAGLDAGRVHFCMDVPDNEVDLYARLLELEEAEKEEEPAEEAGPRMAATCDPVPGTENFGDITGTAMVGDTLGPDLIGVVSQQQAEAGWPQNLETISSIETANISEPSSSPAQEEELAACQGEVKDSSPSPTTTASSSSSSSFSVSASTSPAKHPSREAEALGDESDYQSLGSMKVHDCDSSSPEWKMEEGGPQQPEEGPVVAQSSSWEHSASPQRGGMEADRPRDSPEEDEDVSTPPVSSVPSSLSSMAGEEQGEGKEGGMLESIVKEGVEKREIATRERTVSDGDDGSESPWSGGSDGHGVVDDARQSDGGDYSAVGGENGVNSIDDNSGGVAHPESGFGNRSRGDGQCRDDLREDEDDDEGGGDEGEGSSSESPSDQATNAVGRIAPYWIPDEEAPHCQECGHKFTVLRRRHHCRACGRVLCAPCCHHRAPLHYLDYKEARVCLTCLQRIHAGREDGDSASPSGSSRGGGGRGGPKPADPNNPMDYCSRVPPPQQAVPHAPPPTVMVPVGVLKREGSGSSSGRSRSSKQVMFSDGIRPGGDLTELDGSSSSPSSATGATDPTQPSQPQQPQQQGRKGGRSSLGKRLGSPDRCFIPTDDRLPPVLVPGGSSESVSVGEADLEEQLFGEGPPVVFALNKNLTVLVKVVKMECCVGVEVWNVATRGLCTVGQEELVLLLELLPGERQPPKDIFAFFHTVYQQASQGKLVTELGHTIFTEALLGSREHGGFLYVRPSFQCLHKLVLPPAPYLFALLIQKWEAPWAKVFPLRLLLRLGAEFRYYPCPLVSVRHRKPVFCEIGHTIMNLLVDFRNYTYTVPSIPGLVIHMAEKNTRVHLPRNRYDQVAKALSNSNDHVLALGANFSPQADSHLVTIEDEDGRYTTQAINIHNRPRRVTGASFIVFNGALKTTSGLSAKSSIVEDGLMVQIPADMMVRLREALRNMRDLDIPCGPVAVAAQHPDELVSVRWTSDDKNFNLGIKSPIDSRTMDGIPSVKVTQAQDYAGQMHRIRCTEVFVIQGESSTATSDVNLSRLSEVLARSFCTALTPHLQLLYAGDQAKLGLRATIHQDNVGYESGGCGERLPGVCMKDLDAELIPVIDRAAANLTSDHQPIVLELLFHIMQQ